MRDFLEAAIDNVYKHGDTDIFPFPIENRIIYDQKVKLVEYLLDIYANFSATFVESPPDDIRSLVAVHHAGLQARLATRLSLGKAFLLGRAVVNRRKHRELPIGCG